MDSKSIFFTKGWRSLPDELKLQVLAYTLPANNVYSHYHFRKSHRTGGIEISQLHRLVYPLLSITNIKGVVTEAWYSQNTYHLQQPTSSGISTPLLPPFDVRVHVRNLQLLITHYNISAIDMLAQLADGTLGFTKLRHVKVSFSGTCHDKARLLEHIKSIDEIKIPARLLYVEYTHTLSKEWIDGFGFGTLTDELEMPLLEKLTIQTTSIQANLEWQRRQAKSEWGFKFNTKEEPVSAWPAVSTALLRSVTEKILSI